MHASAQCCRSCVSAMMMHRRALPHAPHCCWRPGPVEVLVTHRHHHHHQQQHCHRLQLRRRRRYHFQLPAPLQPCMSSGRTRCTLIRHRHSQAHPHSSSDSRMRCSCLQKLRHRCPLLPGCVSTRTRRVCRPAAWRYSPSPSAVECGATTARQARGTPVGLRR